MKDDSEGEPIEWLEWLDSMAFFSRIVGRFIYRVLRGFFLPPRNIAERMAQLLVIPVTAMAPVLIYVLLTVSLSFWAQGVACLGFLVYFCVLAWLVVTLSQRYEEEQERSDLE